MENNISTKGTNQTNFKNGDIVVFNNSTIVLLEKYRDESSAEYYSVLNVGVDYFGTLYKMNLWDNARLATSEEKENYLNQCLLKRENCLKSFSFKR